MEKGIFIPLRKNYWFRFFSPAFTIPFLLQSFIPLPSTALTSGPSAPEASGFTPVEAQQLVDPFTGDFSYNIPLLSVGDYPLNLSYSAAGVNMDAEASWVGLGWNLNVGAINRTVRGLPDDFSGDPIQRDFNIKDNITVGGSLGADVVGDMELAGLETGRKLKELKVGGGYSVEIKYNNYTGFSLGQTISASISAGLGAKKSENSFLGAGANIALSSGEGGLDIKPSLSFDKKANGNKNAALGIGANYGIVFNSRQGLKQRSFGVSYSTYSKGINVLGGRGGGSRTAMFNTITYTPKFEFPFHSSAFTFSFKAGGKIFPVEISGTAEGFFSKQALTTHSQNKPAFGYLYLQNGQNNSRALLDFNREKDAAYMHGSPHLPPAYLTYDIFSIGAQGIGGTYRAHRNEAGYVFDPTVYNTSESYSLGGEVNLGNAVKGGVDVGVVMATSHTSSWKNNNYTIPFLQYRPQQANSSKRNFIFKKSGQLSKTVSQDFKNKTGWERPVAFNIFGSSNVLELSLFNQFVSSAQNVPINSSIEKLTEPVQQNETMQILTVSDVQKAGLYQYPLISSTYSKAHHIGQIIVHGDEGKRYVFGLPAYNTYQKEVSFNVTSPADKSDAMVGYSAGIDNSVDNEQGLDYYFDATTTPPFAYCFYLTDVLSSDYIDLTGNGPSQDDYGNYTKVSYTKASNDFKWRTPVELNKAQYDPGLYSLDNDDKGHYVYGTKDIWYPASIETKTEIAVFHTSSRSDALEAINENGGIGGTRSMLRLDSISLYNYSDRILSGNNALPLMRVHFVYDYSLCQGIPNGTTGKLTLKGMYVTNGDTYKGRQSGYDFQYSGSNPDYDMQASDRWGTYKPDSSALPNRIFPYTKQDDKLQADTNASAWLLERIDLPSGGYIHVNYESDQYNYVQDKQAMAMFNVVAAVQNEPTTGSWTNQDNRLCDVSENFPYLIFRLGKSFTNQPSAAYEFVRKSIGDLYDENGIAKNLYFNFMVNMDDGQQKFDRVYGFCELDGNIFGIVQDGSGKYFGWLKVDLVTTDRDISLNLNPISKAAMQFCRLNTPKYAFKQTDLQKIEEEPLQATIDLLSNADLIGSLVDFVKGPNQTLRGRGIGQKFIPEQSYIRLHCFNKLGGGARVKMLTYHNAWNIMQTGEDTLSFTDEYTYTLEGRGDTVSSGVAIYEPMLGGDEIPLHLPVTFSPKTDQPRWSKMLVPDDQYMAIDPYGEMAFPAPSVGYSRVVIRRKVPGNSSAAGTGYSVFHFHTAKEFPVKTENTSINAQRRKKKPFFSFRKKKIHDYLYVTQGYAVELNDMHGRMYRSEIFDANNNLISKTESEYSLDGEVKVLKENGSIENQNLNTDFDFTIDFREQESETESSSVHGNAGTFVIPPIPPFIPAPIPIGPIAYAMPKFIDEKTRFRSAVATKVINRYAILERQTVTDLGARVTTDNLVFDPVTGGPVLTRTNNAYNDILYNFSYPAYIIYPGMNTCSENIGNIITLSTYGNGIITSSASLYPGDELIANNKHGWVYKHTNNLYLINSYGDLMPGENNSTWFIIRSGHRNMLAQNAGTVTTLNNPLTSWGLALNNQKKILNADGVTFRDYWFKPDKHLINKGILSGASYGNEPGGELPSDTCCSCNSTNVPSWGSFFKELIDYNKLVSHNVSVIHNHSLLWQTIVQNGSTLYGRCGVADQSSPYTSPPLTTEPCFEITDLGEDTFNCLNDLLNDTIAPEISVGLTPGKCDSNDFTLWVSKSTAGIYYRYFFPSRSCFTNPPCRQETDACVPTVSSSPPSCNCSLNDYGNFWNQKFSEYFNGDNFFDTTYVLPWCPNPNPNPNPNLDNTGSPFLNNQIQTGCPSSWHTNLLNDTTIYGISTYYDQQHGGYVSDTCFKFIAPSEEFFPLLANFLTATTEPLSVIMRPDCNDSTFTMEITQNFANGVKRFRFKVVSLCEDVFSCTPDETEPSNDSLYAGPKACDCPSPLGAILNPYQAGILGNWRPFESYKFLTTRNPVSTAALPDLRNDGYYTAFYPFWNYNNKWQEDTVTWTRANRITVYDPSGNDLENKNALGIYSSSLFGYNSQLPLALCSNAQFKEMGYDGFEDYYSGLPYSISTTASPCFNSFHLKFEDYTGNVTMLESHTGLYSLRCDDEVSLTAEITPPLCEIKTGNPQCCPATTVPYQLNSCDHLPLFSPNSAKEKEYLLSFWVKDGLPQTDTSSTAPFNLSVEILDSTNNSIPSPTWQFSPPALTYISNDIEGWRQFTYQFTLPSLPAGLHLKTTIKKLPPHLFIDDFRIHPIDALMKSFVFNPFTHLLMAILDENNYAVFFQYDETGQQTQSARRETERGIMSVRYNIIEQKLK